MSDWEDDADIASPSANIASKGGANSTGWNNSSEPWDTNSNLGSGWGAKTEDRRGGGGRPPRGRNGGSGRPKPAGTPMVIEISAQHVGRLIGKAGCKIKELRQNSGAEIEIGEEKDQGRHSETEVKLYGSDKAKENAKKMIYDFLGYNTSSYQETETEDKSDFIDWGAVNANYEIAQKERWAKCPKLIKDFYQEHPEVSKMSEADAAKFREENNNIVVENFDAESTAPILKPAPKFIHSFQNYPDIMATINKQKFEKPSPIQAQAWPYLLNGKDVIGIAQTGQVKNCILFFPQFY